MLLEVSGPYGPLTSSPCGGLAHCTRWGPSGPRCRAVYDGALRAPIARGASAGPPKKKKIGLGVVIHPDVSHKILRLMVKELALYRFSIGSPPPTKKN